MKFVMHFKVKLFLLGGSNTKVCPAQSSVQNEKEKKKGKT